MGLLSQLSVIIISLSGILCGIILTYIAPEEIEEGKHYFLFLKRILFVAILLLVSYFLFGIEKYWLMIIYLSWMIILFIINIKFYHQWLEIVNYLFFLFPYFLISIENYQYLLLSFVFLYGFPLGTLLMKIKNEK